MNLFYFTLIFSIAVFQIQIACGADDATQKELNEAMSERARTMVFEHQAKERLNQAWTDKSYTSPAIEKLRARYRDLQFELIRVREELIKEVSKLPEIKALEKEIQEMSAKEKELAEKIKKLKK